MSQVIDITLVHNGQLFEFTAGIDGSDLLWKNSDSEKDDILAKSIVLHPMTSINHIGDYCPDNAAVAVEPIDEITAIHMQVWIAACAETYSTGKAAIKAFNKHFNIEVE